MDDEKLDREVREALAPRHGAAARVVAVAVAGGQSRGRRRAGVIVGAFAVAVTALVIAAALLRPTAVPRTTTAPHANRGSGSPPGPGAASGRPLDPAHDARAATPSMTVVSSGLQAGSRPEMTTQKPPPRPIRISNVNDTVVVETPSDGTWLIGGRGGGRRHPKKGAGILIVEPGGVQ